MRSTFRSVLPHVLLAGLVFSCTAAVRADEKLNRLTPDEVADGWILLFDGETTFGWQATSDANWKVADGVISVSEGEAGFLCSNTDFGDFELQADFRAPRATNSGIFLRTVLKPSDAAKDCYELNIANPDESPFPTGSFVGRQKTSDYRDNEDWQHYDVTATGGRFVVRLDGHTVLDYTDPQPLGRGRIALQFRSGPVEFRNIKLRPLSQKSLFNGRNLTGWKTYPDMPSVFSVTPEGELNVVNGRGQLESVESFGDFTLQLEVFSRGKELNSGVFFRSIPGDRMNGYECQIHNGYADGDRTKPKDGGTGAIYRRQSARRVVSNDFEWFTLTLIATGPHMAAWVNGVQVTDWTDDRAPDPNPRNGLRLEPGTLMIQGHDPTTDLLFRNIRAVELAPR